MKKIVVVFMSCLFPLALLGFTQIVENQADTELTLNATFVNPGSPHDAGTVVDTLLPGESKTMKSNVQGISRLYILFPRIQTGPSSSTGLSSTIKIKEPFTSHTFVIKHKNYKEVQRPRNAGSSDLITQKVGGSIDINEKTAP